MWHDSKLMNNIANSLVGTVLLSILLSAVWWAINRPMFTLAHIRVETLGQQDLRHVNKLTVRAHAIPKIRGNFFTTNLDAVRAAFEAVPWVKRANVQREWPNKLVVSLEEHTALGTWGENGQLISINGEIFTANLAEAEDDNELIHFSGPPGSEKEVLARYAEFKSWFAQIHLAPDAVDYSERYAWSVTLNNGMQVQLGNLNDTAQLKARVNKLITVYPQLLASLQDSIETIDMRYPNGLALKSSHKQLIGKAPKQASKKT